MSEVLVADAQISRRRVVQGIAWAAPAIAIATAVPAAATSGTVTAFQSGVVTSVVKTGNNDKVVIALTIPAGITVTGATVNIAWTANGGGVGVSGTTSFGSFTTASTTAHPSNFTFSGALSGSGTLTFVFDKGSRLTGSDFVITISGKPNGGAVQSIPIAGDFP